ncbi:MAG: MFS transporter [Alphaproteobacteria bacterium]
MEETPRLSRRIIFSYAVGRAAEGIKSRAFEFFLFFYYVQVLGLSGSLSGLAVGIALIVDAVIDPVAGSFSDNLDTRYGRRHPLMLASILPLGVTFFLLFAPPDGLGSTGLFLWLTIFSVLSRASMALFHVPHLALGAELTDHYTERSTIVAQRTVFAALGSVFGLLAGLNFFLAPTEAFPTGQLNPAGYSPFAFAMALCMGGVILFSTLMTRSIIPTLKKTVVSEYNGSLLARSFIEVKGALGNKSFRALFSGILLVAMVGGVHSTLTLHMSTYYWELSQAKTSAFVLWAGLGFILGLVVLRRAHDRFDKKLTFAVGMAMLAALTAIGPGLRELGLFPGNAHPLLFPLLLALVSVAAFFGALAGVSGGSMMADIADEHELTSGRRQEGVFFSAASFAGKAASAFGHVIAGILIDVIGFPAQAEVGAVAPDKLTQLGLLNGPLMAAVMVFGVIYFMRYDLSRQRHAEIMLALRERRAVS